MKRVNLLLASLFVSMISFAQWTHPAVEAAQPLQVGAEVYLYNIDANGFLLGANDWGTRTSLDPTGGMVCHIEKYEVEATETLDAIAWDGESYFIQNERGPVFADGWDNMWIDRNNNDFPRNCAWTFETVEGNIFKITGSAKNDYLHKGEGYFGKRAIFADNSRLYICNAPTDGVRWVFVPAAKGEEVKNKMPQYLAATKLGNIISKANAAVDLAAEKAVYNNTASTAEQLEAAATSALAKAMAYENEHGTLDNPGNLTALIPNATYDENLRAAWEGTGYGLGYGCAEIFNATPIDYYQTISGLKPGVYRVGVTAFYRSGSIEEDAAHTTALNNKQADYRYAQLFAGSNNARCVAPIPFLHSGVQAQKPELTGGFPVSGFGTGYVPNDMEAAAGCFENGYYEPTTVLGFVGADGKLTIGIQKRQGFANDWVLFDNWTLEFMGTSAEAYQQVKANVLATVTDYTNEEVGDDFFCQQTLFDAYLAASEALENATTVEELSTALPAFCSSYAAVEVSVEAYNAYNELFVVAKDWYKENRAAGESIDMALLGEYVLDEEEPAEGEYNGKGTGYYILQYGTLSAEDITKEAAYLDAIYKKAMQNNLKDGSDCTQLLKNPNFAEEGGWISDTPNAGWPADGKEVGNFWHLFNVHQELENMAEGLYEFETFTIFYPKGTGEQVTTYDPEFKGYIYLNSYSSKMNDCIASPAPEKMDDWDVMVGEGYAPTNSTAAATYFSRGFYRQNIYGIVGKDGKLKLGYRIDRRDEGCTGWWGPAKLTYRAKNLEGLVSALYMLAAEATEDNLIDENYAVNQALAVGNMYKTALQNAVTKTLQDANSNVDNTTKSNVLYEDIVELKQAIDDVKSGLTIYKNLYDAINNLTDAITTAKNPDALTLAQAQEMQASMNAAFENGTLTNEEAENAIEELNTLRVALMLGKGIASEDNPLDMTSAIVNNNFDPARGVKGGDIEGWTTSPTNGYKEYTCSYNRAQIDLHQKLTGLPKGNYKVTVHTYYRAGYWDEEWNRKEAGEETHLTTLYAETSTDKYTKPVMNLYEGALDEALEGLNFYALPNGKFAPDGTSPTAASFAAGYYLNELRFTVGEDGEATIGLKKDEILANDYQVVGEWKLWYMGEEVAEKNDTIDMTSAIVNNNFDPARGVKGGDIEGWTTSPTNGYKEYTCSYNRAAIDLYQDLSGLPKGKYLVTVHTYYRAGYWDEEWARKEAGEETHLTTLYAQTSEDKYTTPVMNLYEGALDEALEGLNFYSLPNGQFAPDGTSPTAASFAAGYYLNKLEFYVGEDGKARIGLKKDEILSNDYQVVGEWKLYRLPESAKLEETDMTSVIVNNNFDPARGVKGGDIEGWTTSPTNGYKEYTCSYNRGAIDLYQDLTGLPEGTYKVTVHTYYRAGYWDEEWARKENGEETHLTTLYAQTADEKYSKPVLNLYEGALNEALEGLNFYSLPNGQFAPDGTSPTAACFAAGHYLNELPFYVSDGKVRIGLSKTEILSNDYQVVGAWHLYYYGSGNNVDQLGGNTPDAIETVEAAPVVLVPVAYYNLNGVRLAAPQRGLNIVKMSDGSALKIMVK